MSQEKKARIALFMPSLRGGGAERVMLNLAKGLTDQGYVVDLVLANAEGHYLQQVPHDINVINLHSTRVIMSLIPLIIYLKTCKPISMLSALNHANIIAFLAVKLANVNTKVVISEHNTLSRASQNPKNFRARIMPLLMKLCYKRADSVIAVSNGVADDLSKVISLSRERIRVIYNPIIFEDFFIKAQEQVIHPWFEDNEPPVILAVGRLTEQKDFPTLLKAFAIVRTERQARLLILGEGEERSQLLKLVENLKLTSDEISLPGFMNNPYAFMSKSKVFVLSSKWEGLPTVLVEALARGCQVISTDCKSGPREILEDGNYGTLVPVGDIYALAKSIKESLDIIDAKKLMGSETFNRYTVSESSKQYLTLLAGVTKHA